MKYHNLFLKILPAAVAALLFSAGCIDLTEDLNGQPTPDKFFNRLSEFDSYIKGAYPKLAEFYGNDYPYVAGSAAEDIYIPNVPRSDRWTGYEQADINRVSDTDEVSESIWNSHYTTIGICNTMLQIIRGSAFDQNLLASVAAEARFLRAFSYFGLTKYFKEVPLVTEDNQSNASVEPDASVQDIYSLIVADLKAAETALPEIRALLEVSRPTSWAAKSLLSKVYLQMAGYPLKQTQYFESARDKAKEVIDSEKYDLVPDFSDLWLYDNRLNNSEFIFTLYSRYDSGFASYLSNAVRPRDGGEGGWMDFSADSRFLDKFPVGNGNRHDGTFYLKMIDGKTWEQSTWCTPAQPFIGKWRDGGPNAGGYTGPQVTPYSDTFYPVMRFADILLVYAEAANMAENGPSVEAYRAINRVRARAGLDDLRGLDQNAFDKAVLDERNWELAFECNRWPDICRRQLLKEVMSEYYPERVIDDHNYWHPKPYALMGIWTGVKQNAGY